MVEGNILGRVSASARTTRRGQRPWHVQTLLAREPGDLAIDRSATAAGPEQPREILSPADQRPPACAKGTSSSAAAEKEGLRIGGSFLKEGSKSDLTYWGGT